MKNCTWGVHVCLCVCNIFSPEVEAVIYKWIPFRRILSLTFGIRNAFLIKVASVAAGPEEVHNTLHSVLGNMPFIVPMELWCPRAASAGGM